MERVFEYSKVMSERIVKFGDVKIATESFGEAKDSPVLLVMGATASMLWWNAEFCQKLADKEHFVIRYDNRDTGRSTAYEPGTINYSIEDLANDAFAVLDAYRIEKANIVGMSLGGLITQMMALHHPPRVLSTAIISSTIFGLEDPSIPPMDEKILELFGTAGNVDWKDERSATDFMVANVRLQAGTRYKFDEDAARKLATDEFRRAKNIHSMMNHAMIDGGEQYYNRAQEIDVPTLVIHGTADPVNAFVHAKILSKTVPNAELLALDNAGHELPYQDFDLMVDAIDKNIRRK